MQISHESVTQNNTRDAPALLEFTTTPAIQAGVRNGGANDRPSEFLVLQASEIQIKKIEKIQIQFQMFLKTITPTNTRTKYRLLDSNF